LFTDFIIQNFLDVKLNFYDAYKAGKEKVNIRSRNYKQISWNTPFSLAITWRKEENAEGCREICAVIRSVRLVLAGHRLR